MSMRMKTTYEDVSTPQPLPKPECEATIRLKRSARHGMSNATKA